ncbi:hypothetical protein [Porcincola intestinalis]|uniref:hypothetical protein n=1 Tax=Porcincola intestinalis TaxID=2606632 RepID=UPI002A7F5CC6|nr:hypothetical protein [Porcincola intestinalis]MDY4204142.1 hypothetical protein [Porcincola intestinalis]
MYVIETLLIVTMFIISIRATFTDLKYGYIYNRDLFMALLPGLALNCIYYTIFVQDIIADFIINLIIVFAIQLLLYKMNSYAGGDLKLGMLLAFLYPARMYVPYKGVIVTLFFYLGYSIFYGYIYLFADSVIKVARHKSSLSWRYVGGYIKNFFISYLRASIFIFAITLIASKIGEIVFTPSWLLWLVCMFISWESRRRRIMQDLRVVVFIAILDVILAVFMKTIPFSIYPETYLFSAVLLVCQMIISSALYEVIATEKVQKGMILSRVSSLLMQGSRVKGLPGISSESLEDRLTIDQAESIRKWRKTKSGKENITIMRKTPFAIFLFLGITSYFVGWVLIYEI